MQSQLLLIVIIYYWRIDRPLENGCERGMTFYPEERWLCVVFFAQHYLGELQKFDTEVCKLLFAIVFIYFW